MQCPACSNHMEPVTVSGITVDICKQGCGGIWFDNMELQRMDDRDESPGALLEQVPVSPVATPDRSQRRTCPKCDGQTMLRHKASPKRKVEVDHCPSCGGYFLDHGELHQIRGNYESAEAKMADFSAMVQDRFGPQIEAMADKREKVMKRRSIFSRLFGRSR